VSGIRNDDRAELRDILPGPLGRAARIVNCLLIALKQQNRRAKRLQLAIGIDFGEPECSGRLRALVLVMT
jgi:hypothetical protein